MKICYIASPSIHTHRWLKYFADNGHEVSLITTGGLSGDLNDNVKVFRLRRFGPYLRAANYLINSIPSLSTPASLYPLIPK